MRPSVPLGRSELEILRYVTDHHPIRVGEVAKHFAEYGKARTTVLTVMERLRAKGHLTRKKVRGTWHYSPKLSQGALLRSVIGRFVEQSLGGSLAPFMAYLAAESDTLSDEEIGKLQQLVQEVTTQRRGGKS